MKKRYSVLISLLLCVVLIVGLFSGCTPKAQTPANPANAQPAQSPAAEVKKENREIAWGSSSTGGGYFYATGVIAPILTDKYDYMNVTNVATGASADNVKRILMGELDFGMAHGTNVIEGYKGLNAMKGLKGDNLRLVAYYMPGPHYFVTLDNKPINNIKDLNGKKVAMGQPGSGAQFNSDLIFDTLGIDAKREYLQFADAERALIDGQIDAIGATGIPVGAISELSETMKIKMIQFTDEDMSKLLGAVPYYYDDKVPAGAYKGIMEPVRVPFVPMFIICHKDLPDYLVYDVLDTIFDKETYKKLGEGYGQWKFTKPGLDIMAKTGVPVHPGAQKWYDEHKATVNFDEFGTAGWVDYNAKK